MLDFRNLGHQLEDFSAFQAVHSDFVARTMLVLKEVLIHYRREHKDIPVHENAGSLIAIPRESFVAVHNAPERPTPLTAVAVDGSQIYPDRNFEPSFFLVNISRIAFQYGTLERPLMEAMPFLKKTRVDLPAEDNEPFLDSANRDFVSAYRDQLELQALLETALVTKVLERPQVAIIDGTLIRWMLRGLRNPFLEKQMIDNYRSLLMQFREESIPFCSYISLPGNTEFVNLLLSIGAKDNPTINSENRAGILDRMIVSTYLEPGERSAVFESASHIQREYDIRDRICYFYVSVPLNSTTSEIGRVEIPSWVGEDNSLLNLVHSFVLTECEKGRGYPMILSEAHEKAVIKEADEMLFYQIIEKELTSKGINVTRSMKSRSKFNPVI